MNKFIFLLYGIFLSLFVAFSYLFIDPGLFYLRFLFTNFHQTHRLEVTTFFILCIGIFFSFYGLFLKKIAANTISWKEIKLLIGISIGILIFAYPAIVSFDIFNYIATAKVAFLYHENPYIIMPIEFTRDPILLFMHAPNKIALYGPVWTLFTAIPHYLGFSNFLITLLTFKAFVGVFYVATICLLWKMTKDILKIAFFALNPLVLFEIFVGGHNDIVMMFLFLLSSYYLFEKKRGVSMLLLLLSTGIKYATAITLPLFFLSWIRPMTKQKFFFYTTLLLLFVFFLSSLREEIYSWYAIWFLLPASFLIGDNLLTWIVSSFSFSMLLRYIPYMLLGTYFGPTPVIKIMLTFIPVILTIFIYFIRKRTLS